jgi:hypothetical protein
MGTHCAVNTSKGIHAMPVNRLHRSTVKKCGNVVLRRDSEQNLKQGELSIYRNKRGNV